VKGEEERVAVVQIRGKWPTGNKKREIKKRNVEGFPVQENKDSVSIHKGEIVETD